MGVYQCDRLICHPYHGHTEFFADFGTYDVEVSLPNLLSIAGTGLPLPQAFKTTAGNLEYKDAQLDPKRPLNHLWKLHAEDVHDFAFAVMPAKSWGMSKFRTRGVDVYVFYQPQNRSQLERMQESISGALKLAQDWFFLYPYPVLTVVEVPEAARAAGGMEYPTFFTTLSLPFDPFRQRAFPELVTIHEFGHQYFQGMLANNEVEEPWLDEGLTTWFTHKAMSRLYQSMVPNRRLHVPTNVEAWFNFWRLPQADPLTRAGHRAFPNGYSVLAYSKPALVFEQLEAMLGRQLLEEALRTYAREYAFKHPTAKDLRRVLERVSGRDLGPFWRDFVEGTEILDYRIAQVKEIAPPAGGYGARGSSMAFATPGRGTGMAQGEIILERKGGLRAPVTLWVRLQDRSEHRVTWNGEDRWTRFEFKAPIEAAILDPDGNYPMLKDRLHASWTRRPVTRGVHYWAQLLWGGVTGLLQAAGLG